MDRPLNVETVLEEKFKKLQSEKTEWVNMGSATHQVRIGLEEVVDTDTLVLRFLPEDRPATRLLDLGTGTGKLLEHLHGNLRLPFSRLVGVSAVDHRSTGSTIPDSSYHITNLDKLNESSLGKDSYKLVFSFATFYHLVDPVGALPEVYSLLAEGGLAIISHVPLAAAFQAADSQSHLKWNSWMAEAGFSVVFLRMMESPGNFLVVMRRTKRELNLPCSYTGRVISAAGTYQHATLTWHPTMSGDALAEKHWVERAKNLLDY